MLADDERKTGFSQRKGGRETGQQCTVNVYGAVTQDTEDSMHITVDVEIKGHFLYGCLISQTAIFNFLRKWENHFQQ